MHVGSTYFNKHYLYKRLFEKTGVKSTPHFTTSNKNYLIFFDKNSILQINGNAHLDIL